MGRGLREEKRIAYGFLLRGTHSSASGTKSRGFGEEERIAHGFLREEDAQQCVRHKEQRLR